MKINFLKQIASNLCSEIVDVETWGDGWFCLNRCQTSLPCTVAGLVTLAIPCAEFLKVKGTPDVTKPRKGRFAVQRK